jgi:hypothetical protein
MVIPFDKRTGITRRPLVRGQSHVLAVRGFDDTSMINVQFAHLIENGNRLLVASVKQWLTSVVGYGLQGQGHHAGPAPA